MLSAAQLTQYHTEGYTVARGLVTPEELAELRGACDELCERARGLTEDTFFGVTFFNILRLANPFAKDAASAPVVPGMVRRVTYPYALSATFNRYRAHPRLLETVAGLLGPDIKQIVNQVNFNPPRVGQGWGWHQDYRFRKQGIEDVRRNFVQTIIAIDPCNTHTGGLRLVPRSFELGDLQLDADNENAERHFDATQAVTPELAPGDVILFNSHMVHGSTANRSEGPRRVYINGYVRASACPTHGMWVAERGMPTSRIQGKMEYEGETKTLPLASKY